MSFKVTFEPSGEVFDVEEGKTILEAALENDIELKYGCKQGKCGVCKCKAVEGEYEIMSRVTDYALTSGERSNRMILLCSTFPESDLVVDLDI